MERLDATVGIDGWQCRYPFSGCCELTVWLGEWITKSDCAGQTDIEGEKGQASSAFKRAAARFGVGRYLYELPSPWVPIENRRIPEAEQKKLTERLKTWQERKYGQ